MSEGDIQGQIGILEFVGESLPVYATRQMDLLVTIQMGQVDGKCLSMEEKEDRTDDFLNAISAFGPDHRIYQTLVQTKGQGVDLNTEHPNPMVEESLNRRANLFADRKEHLFSRELYVTFVWERTTADTLLAPYKSYAKDIAAFIWPERRALQLTRQEEVRAMALLRRVEAFCARASKTFPCRILGRQETKQALRSLVTFRDWNRRQPIMSDTDLDYWLPNARPLLYNDHIWCDGHHLRAMTLRETPRLAGDKGADEKRGTRAGVFAGILNVDCGLIATVEWRPLSRFRAGNRLTVQQKQHHADIAERREGENSSEMRHNPAAEHNVEDLGGALKAIDNGNHVGEFCASILLYDEDPKRVADALPKVAEAFTGAQVLPEDSGTFDAWMAMIPGNHRHNVRTLYAPLAAYADMSLLWGDSTGDPSSAHYLPDRKPLTYFETTAGGVYRFYPNVEDVVGIVIYGQQGGGKTTFGGHILDVFQKYVIDGIAPKTLVMDIKDSFRENTLRHGGTYVTLSLDNPGILRRNPFARPYSKENVERILRLIRLMLAGNDDFRTNPEQDVRIVRAIRNLYLLKERGGLRLARLGGLHLGKDLQPRLAPWIGSGQYAAFFDNAEDAFMDCDWLTCQYAGFNKHTHILLPLLYWDWEWFDDLVSDPALTRVPKLFVADELHVLLLMSDVVGPYLLSKINTGRSFNLWNMFILQWAPLLEKNAIGTTLNSACPMKIFTASESVRATGLSEIFEMTPHIANQIKHLAPKEEVLVHTARGSKVLRICFDQPTLDIYANDVESNATRYETLRRISA